MKREFRPGDPGTDDWTFTKDRWDATSLIEVDGTLAVIKVLAVVNFTEGEPARGHFNALLVALEARFSVEHESPNPRMTAILKRKGLIMRAHGLAAYQADPNAPMPVERWYRP
jgi:hypothetical protein